MGDLFAPVWGTAAGARLALLVNRPVQATGRPLVLPGSGPPVQKKPFAPPRDRRREGRKGGIGPESSDEVVGHFFLVLNSFVLAVVESV